MHISDLDTPAAAAVLGVLDRRGSVRDYEDTKIPDAVVERLVAAAQRVPTDASGQMYTFVRITDDGLRERIAEIAGGQDHVRTAAEFFVVCADVHRLARLLEHRGETFGMGPTAALLFGITDAALAAQALALTAEAMGLGICFIGGIQADGEAVAELLDLPSGVLPLWGLCIGVPATEPNVRPRVPTRAVLMENGYVEPDEELLDGAYAAMAPAARSGDWVHGLVKYFADGGNMAKREPLIAGLMARQGFKPD